MIKEGPFVTFISEMSKSPKPATLPATPFHGIAYDFLYERAGLWGLDI